MPLSAGTRLGPYEILGAVGAGGMGEVYRAIDPRLGREVAIKRLPDALASDPESLRQFHTEARSVAALNHPNICTLHEISRENGLEYLVMELVEGRPISDLLAGQSLPVDQVIHYGIQIADALTHAHDHHIVHRDLKSANVMVTSSARIKVVDFGLARRLQQQDMTALTRSETVFENAGSIAGTLPYLPPEALRGAEVDTRGDIWALGVMLYEMAAGRRPFAGPTVMELASAILREPPDPLPPDVPAGLGGSHPAMPQQGSRPAVSASE
jgi:eukaryotic-like serine/threonine-protein kinase